MLPSDHAREFRYIADGTSNHPGRWSNDRTPYVVEPMDCMAPSHPCESVAWMKSAQVAGSELITNVIFYVVDQAPGMALVVHPTIEAGMSWNAEKLQPNIEATPQISRKLLEAVSRDGSGSTQKRKRFPGGQLVITGANSAAGLRQKSVRWLFRDDLDEFPFDVNGQGDPAKMAEARQISYIRSGLAKRLDVSTPTTVKNSRIYKLYLEGDQRRYYVPCPHCQHMQVLEWTKPLDGKDAPQPAHGLHWSQTDDGIIRVWYACIGCGADIENYELDAMLRGGKWIAENPGPGRQPSFWIGSLYSPFYTWLQVVKEYLLAVADPSLMQTFVNLVLGLPYEGGQTASADALLKRIESWELQAIPTDRNVLISGYADVQEAGIYYEVVVWGPGKESWSIDIGYLAGDTSDEGGAVWSRLDEVRRREYVDPYGGTFPIDVFGVDSGYNAHAVYAWVRRHHNTFATKGEDGATIPQIFRTPQSVDRRKRSGKTKKYGTKVWLLGTWKLKAEVQGMLRRAPKQREDGDAADGDAILYPPGYCHFSAGHDEDYFKQLTDETFQQKRDRKTGRVRMGWHGSGHNHFFDCRVGNLALYYKEELHLKTADQIAARMARRRAASGRGQADLFEAKPAPVTEQAAVQETAAPVPAPVARRAPPRIIDLGGF